MTNETGKWAFSDEIAQSSDALVNSLKTDERWNSSFRTITTMGQFKFFYHTYRRKPKIKPAIVRLPQSIKKNGTKEIGRMTDEQIEKALGCCACMNRDGCNGCPMEFKKDKFYSCTIEVSEQALDYIKRLRTGIELLDKRLTEKRPDELNCAKEALKSARQETAKEILLDLKKDISQCYGEYALSIVDEYIEKYGVEVEE